MNTSVVLNSCNNNNNKSPTNAAALPSVSSLHTGEHITPVYLNLYDLGGCANACVHSIGLSFYHCSIQAHSAEYGFMGHPYRFTGLYKTSKHDPRFHLYHLRDSLEVGWTWLNEKEIDRIVTGLSPYYPGCDYDTTNKNSIHFARFLLEQLANDPERKHHQPIKIIEFPSYIDRIRRLTRTLEFVQMFDREKDIAEINILYFLYMKYQGNMNDISQDLKCDTIDKLKRCVQLIEQGIRRKELPIYQAFMNFEMNPNCDCLRVIDQNRRNTIGTDEKRKTKASTIVSDGDQLTLTDIFHQFDTITLRGRTSIDRYLNIQHPQSENEMMTKPLTGQKNNPLDDVQHVQKAPDTIEISQKIGRSEVISIPEGNDRIVQIMPTQQQQHHQLATRYNMDNNNLRHYYRPSLPQPISQNQGQTPVVSTHGSNISGFDSGASLAQQQSTALSPSSMLSSPIVQTTPVFMDPPYDFGHLHLRTAVPVGTVLRLQETPNPNVPLTELHLTTDGGRSPLHATSPLSTFTSRHRQIDHHHHHHHPLLKRKLPRDLEPKNDLYTISTHPSSRYGHTNNATCPSLRSHRISFPQIESNDDTDSNV